MRPWRLLLVAGSVALALGAASGCSDWPPGDRSDGGSTSGPGTRTGYCGGTPLPCPGLNGEQCEATGCDDFGSCLGSGVTCPNERSSSSCASRSDCYWSPLCSGVPVGCIAATQDTCKAMPGCVWTPTGGGSGGAGSGGVGGGSPAPNCPSLDRSCTTSANCDCNMQCLVLCNMCASTCAKSCRTDADCVGTGGNDLKTPYCVKFTSSTWACSPNPPAM